MLELALIALVLAALAKGSGSSGQGSGSKDTTKPSAQQQQQQDTTAADALNVAKAAIPLAATAATALVGILGGGGTAAGTAAAGSAAASGGAAGAASGAASGAGATGATGTTTAAGLGTGASQADVIAAGGTTAIEAASESAALVAAEGGIVLAAVVVVGVVVATLATTDAHNAITRQRASLGVPGLYAWVWSRISAIEQELMRVFINAQGGQQSRHNDVSVEIDDPRYQMSVLDKVWGIPTERLAAAAILYRYAAVEQTRAWARGVRAAVKWDLEHSDNWGSRSLSWTDIEKLGWGLSDEHLQDAIDQYYRDNNPTGYGLFLVNGIATQVKTLTSGGRSPLLSAGATSVQGVNKRTWLNDNTDCAGLMYQPRQTVGGASVPLGQPVPFLAYHRWIGRLQSVDFMINVYQPFAGVQEPFTAFGENFSQEYDLRARYAANTILAKYDWGELRTAGPFVIDPDARQAFDPSAVANSGQIVAYPLDPSTNILIVDGGHPTEPL